MAITRTHSTASDIPESLRAELLAWFSLRDMFASKGGSIAPETADVIDRCTAVDKSCKPTRFYQQEYATLRALKSLRVAAEALVSVTCDRITRMEKTLLPASRFYGIRALPNEVLVQIVDFAFDHFATEPTEFSEMMRTVHPFCKLSFEDAGAFLARKEKHRAITHVGYMLLGEVGSDITRFILDVPNNYTSKMIRDNFKRLTALEHLEISCQFDYKAITRTPNRNPERITLPSLKSLSVSNLKQADDIDIFVSYGKRLPSEWNPNRPLRNILRMLEMPLLSRISARVYTEEEPGAPIAAINYLFCFEGPRKYPCVKSFELEEIRLANSTAWASLDLSKAFNCLPAIESLTLGSCHTILYEGVSKCVMPSGLSLLRLQYGDELSADECCVNMTGLIQQLLLDGNLKEARVVTTYHDVFDYIRTLFRDAQWVTNRSILDT